MPVNVHELIGVLADLCDKEGIKVCIAESVKGALITGISAGLGGLLLGPLGLAIGGAVGGAAAAASSKNKFLPAAVVLKNLTPSDKEKLRKRLQHAFENVGISDLTALVLLIQSHKSLQELAINEVKNFLTSDLSHTLKY